MRVVGLAVFFLSIPIFFMLAKGNLAQRRALWFALGIGPFVINAAHLDVSIISWAAWPGYVKGMIVSLLDSAALAVACSTREPVRGRPLMALYLLFFIGSAVSIFFANLWLASFFFTWQLARAILVFLAVSMAASRPDGAKWVISGMSVGVAIQAGYSLQERAHGVTQASGTLGHQNLLGLATNFALLMALAAMLSGDRRWVIRIGAMGAIIAVVLTGSRATTGLAAGGAVALLLLSMIRKPTAFKTRIAGIGFLALLVAAPVAYSTLNTRFEHASSDGSDEEREAFERAAKMMWKDHPMGVGANQYVVRANSDGYSAAAGVIWNYASRAANVHNTYLLLGAETGYLGLGTFVLLLVAAILKGFRVSWAKPRGPAGELALGATVALCVAGLHCFYEWVFVTWVIQYIFAITLGLIAGAAKQQQAEVRMRQQARRVLRQQSVPLGPPLPA